MKKKPYALNTLEPGMLQAEEGDTLFRRFHRSGDKADPPYYRVSAEILGRVIKREYIIDDDNRRISQALEEHVNEYLADTRTQMSQELKDLASTTLATLMLIAVTAEAPNQNKLIVYWINVVRFKKDRVKPSRRNVRNTLMEITMRKQKEERTSPGP
jgi:hypothetical protein